MSTSSNRRKIFVSAGEYSGSVYVASVVRSLLKSYPELEFVGVGGRELEDSGVRILYNSDQWGSIGVMEAIKRWYLFPINWKIQNYLESEKPDLLFLSDYPGFNMHLARKAKQIGIPCVYLFPPRKFAQSPNDIRDAAQNIKRVAAEFEPTYTVYKDAGATVDFVGHPMLDSLPKMNRSELRQKYSLDSDERVILIMPGSRQQEIQLLLPMYEEVAIRLSKEVSNLRFHLLGAENLADLRSISSLFETSCRRMMANGLKVDIHWSNRFEHMCIADMALVTSGTATLELSFYQVPMVICYKVTRMTAMLAQVFTDLPDFIGLPNLLSKQEVVPEFIQDEANPENVAKAILKVLKNPDEHQRISELLGETLNKLGSQGAINRINRMILEELDLPCHG